MPPLVSSRSAADPRVYEKRVKLSQERIVVRTQEVDMLVEGIDVTLLRPDDDEQRNQRCSKNDERYDHQQDSDSIDLTHQVLPPQRYVQPLVRWTQLISVALMRRERNREICSRPLNSGLFTPASLLQVISASRDVLDSVRQHSASVDAAAISNTRDASESNMSDPSTNLKRAPVRCPRFVLFREFGFVFAIHGRVRLSHRLVQLVDEVVQSHGKDHDVARRLGSCIPKSVGDAGRRNDRRTRLGN